MNGNSDEQPTDIERQLHAIELKNEAHELTGGKMHVTQADDIDPAIEEQFWENVVAYEKAPFTTALQKLEQAGVAMPPPEALSDEGLALKLWEAIDALARMQIFVESTNHLSDRELYTHLVTEALREEMPDLPIRKNSARMIDIIGSGSEEDMLIYHRFYADLRSRRSWLKNFPDYIMPKREKPAHDRDRHMPKWDLGLG